MKYVCKDDNEYMPMGDNIKIVNNLPAQIYSLDVDKFRGIYLNVFDNKFNIEDTKIYGNYETKINKIIKSFNAITRNMGIIMSGDKGLGKSLTAKVLCNHLIELGYPIILCNEQINGIVDFLHNIKQTVIIFFDEFDKVFTSVLNNGDDTDKPQEQFLSLFDGVDNNKKLFLITCNDIFQLNDFFINRPGRFHYNIHFEYPSTKDVEEYMKDNLLTEFHKEIPAIMSFANQAPLNYDSLRAIAFELNLGESFKSTIEDLNILDTDIMYYNIFIYFNNGVVSNMNNISLELNSKDKHRLVDVQYNNKDINFYFDLYFNKNDIYYDNTQGCYIVKKTKMELDYRFDKNSKEEQEFKTLKIKYVAIKRIFKSTSLHWAI